MVLKLLPTGHNFKISGLKFFREMQPQHRFMTVLSYSRICPFHRETGSQGYDSR